MAINFYKNHDQIVGAYKEVLDPKCNTNWALFGYEKQTNDLVLVDKGDGGLEELYDEFSQSKILYAFCEAKDQNSQVSRYILINWQGECAPLQRKGVCMNHFADVSSFFKGAHVELNARNEEDVEPAALMQHVSKLSSRFKYDKTNDSSQPRDNQKPIGTNYKRIVPQNEISKTERELFWQKQKQEEEERLSEAKKKEATQKQDIANVKRDETLNLDVQPKIQSNQIRKERLDEAKSIISKNSINNAKAFFEKNSAVSQINNKPERIINIKEEGLREPISLPTANDIKEEKSSTNGQLNGNHKEEEEEIDDVAEKVVEEANQIDSQSQELNAEESTNDELFSSKINFSNEFLSNNFYPEPRTLENIEEEQVNEDGEVLTNKDEPEMSQGLRAKALYDYQAADDTEISFDPDDIITHIEQIDSGWWQGLAPNGTYGLFPANYVELVE